MALTRDFRETVQARAKVDPLFGEGLLREGVQFLLGGEIDAGMSLLRDYINATIGFEELGARTNKSPKCLMRMLGPHGNPLASDLFEIVGHIQDHENVQLEVMSVAVAEKV